MTSSQIELLKDRIVKHVMDCEPYYESEYDNRVEEYCFYCGAYADPRKGTNHEMDCVWMAGQVLKGVEK